METKKCSKCNLPKSLDDFHENTRRNGKAHYCKECMSKYKKEHYILNKEQIKKQNLSRKILLRKKFKEFKSTLKCENCSESRWWVLDFHHVDPKTKERAITDMMSCTLDRVKKEIEKCKVLCSNCHRDLHYQEKYKRGR